MGNTRYHTKDNGQSYAELEYDIWGNPTSPNMLINNDNGVFIFATFTGHIYDTVLDIYFAEARFYDAKNRQWMNSDPMKDGLNWYQYVRANPATWVDPFGLYNRVAAAQYAENYGGSYNPDYLAFDTPGAWVEYLYLYRVKLGSDCANFVSQSLLAGGIDMNEEWHYYKTENKPSFIWTLIYGFGTNTIYYETEDGEITHRAVNYDFTPAWSMANAQYQYFVNMHCISDGEVVINSDSKKDINDAIVAGVQIGDLLYWDFDGNGTVNHATMITRVDGNKIYYSGHTNFASSKPLFETLKTNYPNGRVYIVKIRDDA